MMNILKQTKIFVCVFALVLLMIPTSCGGMADAIPETPHEIKGLTFEERVALEYADQFAIDRYAGGYSMIYVADGGKYLVVPEGGEVPNSLGSDVKVINCPLQKIYLAATSVMGLFDALDGGSAVQFSGTKAEDWYIEYARNAMERGDMLYAGKYREPDYELLLENGCTFSIQSTMIEHTPEVKEKLTELGITVFVDYSSYESHPLGRSEWIKVYGEMMGKADEAEQLFQEQVVLLNAIGEQPSTGKTVVFFYISNSGQAVTRKSGDYVTKMIELAGGKNVFDKLDNGNATSTVKMEMEEFYTTAKDADFIIYNSTIGSDPQSLDEIIAKNGLLADFKAVKEDNVWCTHDNLFQETMKLGAVIADFHSVFSGTAEDNPPQYLYHLEGLDQTESEAAA